MKIITTALSLLVFSVCTIAQKTDFSGTWIFQEQESISGKLYSNGSPKQVTIKQTPANIWIEKMTAGPNGDIASAETLTFDGKNFSMVSASKRTRTITHTWSADGKSFTENTTISAVDDPSKIDRKVTDTWSMENGELMLTRKDENMVNGEVWESRALYAKQ